MRLAIFILCLPAFAQISSKLTVSGRVRVSATRTSGGGGGGLTLTVVGVSNTQAVISYTAPSTSACTVEASESATYLSVVHDVDGALFTGATSDDRDGNLGAGTTTRVIRVGTRVVDHALDTSYYSRALQAYTAHYVRITCGASVGTTVFTTANIPGGLTHQDVPRVKPAADGTWILPTITANNTTTQSVIDSHTGAYLVPVTKIEDRQTTAVDGYYTGEGGFIRPCTAGLQSPPMGADPVYVCQIFYQQTASTGIWSINPATGQVKSLGFLGPSATATATGQLQMGTDMGFIASSSGVATKYIYTGDWQEHPPVFPHYTAPDDGGHTYSTVSLSDQLLAFDATFDPTLFGCPDPPYANLGVYKQFKCDRIGGGRDVYGWIAMYSGGDGRAYDPMCTPAGATCPGIVAAFLPFNNIRCRWCANHNFQNMSEYPANPTTPVMFINWQGLTNNSDRGQAQWGSNLTNNVMSGATSFQVDTLPVSQYAGGDTFDPGGYQIGDKIYLPTGDQITVITGVSGSGPYTLTVSPALSSGHSSGEFFRMECNARNLPPPGISIWMIAYWEFVLDPHATDTTNTTLVFDRYFDGGGHLDDGIGGRIAEGWPVVAGNITTNLDIPIPLTVPDSPAFHGLASPGGGSRTEKHPSWHQTSDTPAGIEREWFLDQTAFDGDAQAFGGSDATNITGTLYKYTPPTDPSYSPMYTNINGWRKVLPFFAVSGGKGYLDISGPGSVIGGTSGDNWKVCVALIAGECVGASSVGDIYFNPGITLDTLHCTGGDGPDPRRKDICIAPSMTYANGVPQLLSTATDDTNGTRRSRVLTQGLRAIRQGLQFIAGKPLPDGSWTIFYSGTEPCSTGDDEGYCNLWMIKNPPFPAQDAYDRSDYIPTTVTISSVPATTTNVIVRFGYLEFGTTSELRCTTRLETCVVNGATISPAPDLNPFRFPTEGIGGVESGLTGVSCTSSCTVDLPTISRRIGYYQVVYRNSSNATVSTGPLQLAIVP